MRFEENFRDARGCCSTGFQPVPGALHGLKARAISIALLLISLVTGCATVPAGKSVVSGLSSNPSASEVEFWHTLQTRPLATHDDAFHALLIYTDGDDPATNYEARVSTL